MPPFASNSGLTTKALILRLDDDDDDAEQKARMSIERRTELEVRRELARVASELYPPDSEPQNAYTESVRAAEAVTGERMRDVLSRALQDSADLGVSVAVKQFENVGFGFDYTLANESARAWALRHTDDLLAQLGTTTARVVGQSVARWINNGEPLSALVRDLQPAFGRQRAKLIAATEVTRAYAQGSKEAYVASGFVKKLVWQASMDERVCIYCGSLHGKVVGIEESFDSKLPADLKEKTRPFALPPAHVGCRCWILPEIEEVKERKPKKPKEPKAPKVPKPETPVLVTPKPALTEIDTPEPIVKPVLTPVPEDTSVVMPEPPPLQAETFQYQPSQRDIDIVTRRVDSALSRSAQRNGVPLAEFEQGVREGFEKLVAGRELAIQFPSNQLDVFLADPRFKTQFETNSSGGMLNQETRAEAEFYGLGAPLDLNPRDRPIYGYVNLGKIAQRQVAQYGDITFILKDTVRERTTVTMDDSLYNFGQRQVAGTPINSPSKASWDGQFTSLYKYNRTGDLNEIFEEIPYLEIQIQRGVSIADVRGIIDRRGRLTATQRERLKRLGVEVWDD